MFKIRKIKQSLNACISDLCNNPSKFLNNPQSDFKRNRKLSMSKIIKLILYMSGGTLHKELLEFFVFSMNTPTASAFLQQRSKIRWSAFKFLFHSFNKSVKDTKLYRRYTKTTGKGFYGKTYMTYNLYRYTINIQRYKNYLYIQQYIYTIKTSMWMLLVYQDIV